MGGQPCCTRPPTGHRGHGVGLHRPAPPRAGRTARPPLQRRRRGQGARRSRRARDRTRTIRSHVSSCATFRPTVWSVPVQDATMLVIGARTMGATRAMALNSISRQVLRHATCPVAVIRDDADRSARPIVIGVDGSPSSRRALQWGLDLARTFGCGVIALHAWHLPFTTHSLVAPYPSEAELTASAADFLHQQLERADTSGLRHRSTTGPFPPDQSTHCSRRPRWPRSSSSDRAATANWSTPCSVQSVTRSATMPRARSSSSPTRSPAENQTGALGDGPTSSPTGCGRGSESVGRRGRSGTGPIGARCAWTTRGGHAALPATPLGSNDGKIRPTSSLSVCR